ncbi:MAG TPA: EF-hand domain-containing protein [Aliiroseovarius sp.]|nr:EF-hand domain-containing protein [Aliiroseovarius sp.]
MKNLAILGLAGLLALGTSAAQAQTPGAHFIENFDDNGDGQVTLEEVRTKRADIFYMFDQNEDGVLDSAEYDLFDETRAADHENEGNGRGKGRQGEGMARDLNDLNGDGVVTQEEFLDATDAWFTMRDRNGDGVLTTADFGPRGG